MECKHCDSCCLHPWNIPPRFGQAVEALFEDLTPFLAGDKVKKYKNLANLPTDAWRFGVFNDKLYALPFPGEGIGNAIFRRGDLFAELGIEAAPTTADELLELAKEVTDPSKNRWGANDMWVDIDFSDVEFEAAVAEYIKRLLSQRYPGWGGSEIEWHC